MIPGEIIVARGSGELPINVGLETKLLEVANTGDRPIQIGSHFHFYEVNSALRFDRAAARGFRLNIAAGTAVRFEPGDTEGSGDRRPNGGTPRSLRTQQQDRRQTLTVMLEVHHEDTKARRLAQLLTYLKLSGHRLGFLINFNVPILGGTKTRHPMNPSCLRAFVVKFL